MSSQNRHNAEKILDRVKMAYGISSDAELARFLDVGRSTPHTWRKRDSPDFDVLFSKCGDLSFEWLLRSDGPVHNEDVLVQKASSDTNFVAVPIYADTLGAGDGDDGRDEILAYGKFFEGWLRGEVGLRPESAFVAPVRGRSMEDLLYDGDLVLCEETKEIQYEDIYACRLNEELKVKHAHRSGNAIVLRSENTRYPDIEVGPGDDFAPIGRVVRRIVR